MKRRIFGLENEYGLTCTLNGEPRLSPENVARYLFEKVIPGTRNANVFLENGARLYLDTGLRSACARMGLPETSSFSRTTRTRRATATAATRTTSSTATCHFSAWPR